MAANGTATTIGSMIVPPPLPQTSTQTSTRMRQKTEPKPLPKARVKPETPTKPKQRVCTDDFDVDDMINAWKPLLGLKTVAWQWTGHSYQATGDARQTVVEYACSPLAGCVENYTNCVSSSGAYQMLVLAIDGRISRLLYLSFRVGGSFSV